LNIAASIPALQSSGLWRRECWYFDSVPASLDVLPESPCRLKWCSLPAGWKSVDASSCVVRGSVAFHRAGEPVRRSKKQLPARVVELQRVFWRDVSSRAWLESPTRGELLCHYQSEVISTGREGFWRDWRARRLLYGKRRLHSLSVKLAGSYSVSSDNARSWVPKWREPRVWLPTHDGETEEEDFVWEPWRGFAGVPAPRFLYEDRCRPLRL